MVHVSWNGNTWDEVDKECSTGFYIDSILKTKLDNIKKIIKKGWDCVILIDGKERSGKSTLGITLATYLSDNKFTNKDICAGMQDAAQKIRDAADGDILMMDEGSLVFSSKDTMSRNQKSLMKILDVVGQKHLTLIVILPSFFDLNRAIAIRRSRFLLHVYTDNDMNRGRFSYFGESEKAKLYEIGRKNFGSYNKPDACFIGKFSNYVPPFYEEYLKIKKESLIQALDVAKEVPLLHRKWMGQRDAMIGILCEKFHLNQTELSRELSKLGANLTAQEIGLILKKNPLENAIQSQKDNNNIINSTP